MTTTADGRPTDATYLLDQTRATLTDAHRLAAQHANWRDGCPILTITTDRILVAPDDLTWVRAFLAAAADQRREDRILAADRALTAAHDALLAKNRTRRNPQWPAEMLVAFHRLTAALLELIDAREDADEIDPARAARLRAAAAAELRTTEQISAASMRAAIRLVRNA